MSNQNETSLNHGEQLKLLHKHVKSFIILDPECIASNGKIKIGDTVTGHVVLINDMILCCKEIHVALMGQSSISVSVTEDYEYKAYQSIGSEFLIPIEETENGVPVSLSELPKGTHMFPFSLLIVNRGEMAPSFNFWYAECNYEIQTIIRHKNDSYKLGSIPVKISDYMNIRPTTEYQTPIRHQFQGNTSPLCPDEYCNIRILVEIPRGAYCGEEGIPVNIQLQKFTDRYKIKNIQVSLVRKDGYTYIYKPEFWKETKLVSRTIKPISELVPVTIIVPKDLRQSFDFICRGRIQGKDKVEKIFQVTMSYFIKVTVKATNSGKQISDMIPIVIGTDNIPLLFSCTGASQGDIRYIWTNLDSQCAPQLSLHAYSKLSLVPSGQRRRRKSQKPIEARPTFIEAIKLDE